MMEKKTLAEQYFMRLYSAATLRGAAERAALREFNILKGFENFSNIPIDVGRIAERRGIHIRKGLEEPFCGKARLIPIKGGFLLHLKNEGTKYKKRFSLAHEIGHTIFYKDSGDRPRHQIGVLDDKEIKAEERICDLFARALLMPASYLRQAILPIPTRSPHSVLTMLDQTARKFQVGLPALIERLAELNIESPPYMILRLRFQDNKYTNNDPRLRVERCTMLDGSKRFYIPPNRSTEGLNIKSVSHLFGAWRDRLTQQHEPEWGQYTWHPDFGLIRATEESVANIQEDVNICTRTSGKWKKESLPMNIASCLYARRNKTEREAYLIAVLTPKNVN